MNNSHTPSSDYRNYPRSQQAYRRTRSLRITFRGTYVYSFGRRHHTSVDHPPSPVRLRNDEPYVSRQQGTITTQNYQPLASTGVYSELIRRILHRRLAHFDDSLDDDLEDDMDDRTENEEDDMYDQLENEEDDMDDRTENEDDDMDDQMEKEEDAILLGYSKIRTHHVAASKYGVNNPMEPEDQVADREPADVCAICQSEFEHEETIGTLLCGHEYHTDCIKQWLLRKKDCPMCRASVFPSHQKNHVI